jgi:hemin uptake protein HemP
LNALTTVLRTIIVRSVSPVKQDAVPKAPDERRRIPSEQLLGRAGEAVILHNGREYKLRKTQNGKLILTA